MLMTAFKVVEQQLELVTATFHIRRTFFMFFNACLVWSRRDAVYINPFI